MNNNLSKDKGYFDFQWHWRQGGGKLSKNPLIIEKIKVLIACIPAEVKTIVDVGCGDGAITNALAEKYRVVGVERVREGLKYLSPEVRPINGSAENIPIKENDADLILSSELLEHLPDEVFLKAISEIKRVSRKYILVSVPNDEELRKRHTKCNNCGIEFHIYGHLRSFTLDKLVSYFNGYRIVDNRLCGALESKSFQAISYLRNKLANSYFVVTGVSIKCPHCGKILEKIKRSPLQKLIDLFLKKIQLLLNLILNRKVEPDWLIVLLEKEGET